MKRVNFLDRRERGAETETGERKKKWNSITLDILTHVTSDTHVPARARRVFPRDSDSQIFSRHGPTARDISSKIARICSGNAASMKLPE